MAVTFDAVGPAGGAGQTTVTGTTNSWTHVVGATATALIVGAGVGASPDTGITQTCTVNGSGISSLGLIHNANTNQGFIQAFGLINPPTGSVSIVVTCSSSGQRLTGGSLSFIGAATFSALQSLAGGPATSGTLPFTGSTTGNLIASVFGGGSPAAGAGSMPGGAVEYNCVGDPNSAGGNSAGGYEPSVSSSTVNLLWNINASDDWGILGIEVQQATSTPAAPNRLLTVQRPVVASFWAGPWGMQGSRS